MKIKICFVTTSRSDYSLQSIYIKKFNNYKNIDLNLVVSGTHFSKAYGNTYKLILNDGFKINKKIKLNINKKKDNLFNINSVFFYEISKYLNKIKPQCIVLLGDRLEILLTSIVAYTLNIPIIHIGGGELTHGSVDDSYRHAISKMSSIHCVSNNIYKKRLIRLGENPSNIYITGDPSNEIIKKEKILPKKLLEKKYKIKLFDKNILFTYHPETSNLGNEKKQIINILKFLESIEDNFIIFTHPNNDLNAYIILNEIKKFTKKNKNSILISNLGRQNYLSFLKHVDLLVGNSSSGLTEAPQLGTPTLNIGTRQEGRVMEKSVYNSDSNIKNLRRIYNKINIKNSKNAFSNIKLINSLDNFSDNLLNVIKNTKNFYIKKKFYEK